MIAEARARSAALGLYVWLVAITGALRGELCAVRLADIDLELAQDAYLFSSDPLHTKPWNPDWATHQVAEAAAAAG